MCLRISPQDPIGAVCLCCCVSFLGVPYECVFPFVGEMFVGLSVLNTLCVVHLHSYSQLVEEVVVCVCSAVIVRIVLSFVHAAQNAPVSI